MAKEKKITVKFYFNGKVRPKVVLSEFHHPIYAQVTYNRKTTHLLFDNINPRRGVTENEFKEIFESNIEKWNEERREIEEFRKNIISVIRYEENLPFNNFSFKGFSERLKLYSGAIGSSVNFYIRKKLLLFLEDYLTVTQYKDVKSLLECHKVYLQTKIKYLPNLKISLHNNLRIELTAFFNYLHFANHKGKYSNKLRSFFPEEYSFISWIKGSTRDDFEEFLRMKESNSFDYEYIKVDEYEYENIENVINELEIKYADLDVYLEIFDSAVLEYQTKNYLR